jgi:N4-gp56 family major capsid protein
VAPIDGTNYGAMLSPGVGATLAFEAGPNGWVEAAKYAGPDRLITGEIGTYRGVRFFVNARIPAKTGVVFPTFIFGKEAIAWADVSSLRVTSVSPSATISDPLAQRGAAGFAVRAGGMLVSDVAPDTTTRRYRFVVIESTADPLLAAA